MANLIVLFNHHLTDQQEQEARERLGVRRIVHAPAEVRTIWAALPPDEDGLAASLAPVRSWLAQQATPGDFALIQGDFGACYLMVGHALALGCVPLYSTTRREAREERLDDGSIRLTHHFRHVRFRNYGK
ncbi:MAG: hypothetical protein BWK76_06710 [Desulfobulbaceae bacterium A2]|nr:MAG: hypothetical protein BWK76_06710 [Desulfobulbaceae bacterium A2]